MDAVFVLGTGVIGLGVTRALAARNVPVIGGHHGRPGVTSWSRHVRKLIKVPRPAGQKLAFINCLAALGAQNEGCVLMPADDEMLLASGINFPWIIYQALVEGEQPAPMDFRDGVYWTNFIKDVTNSWKQRRHEGLTLGKFLEP